MSERFVEQRSVGEWIGSDHFTKRTELLQSTCRDLLVHWSVDAIPANQKSSTFDALEDPFDVPVSGS